MTVRNGLTLVARTLLASKSSLPLRGGVGMPVKMAPLPSKKLPLWDEERYDDGSLYGSEQAIDGWGEPTRFTLGQHLTCLSIVLSSLGLLWYTCSVPSPEEVCWERNRWPPEVAAAFQSHGGLDCPSSNTYYLDLYEKRKGIKKD